MDLPEQNYYIPIPLFYQIIRKVEISILAVPVLLSLSLIKWIQSVVDIKEIKTEIPSTSIDTDFLMDQLDNGYEQNEEETLLHYGPIDYSVDDNEQNEEKNWLQSATSNPIEPDGFDYVNPFAEFLFQFLLVEVAKYEVMIHLKCVRENKVYDVNIMLLL